MNQHARLLRLSSLARSLALSVVAASLVGACGGGTNEPAATSSGGSSGAVSGTGGATSGSGGSLSGSSGGAPVLTGSGGATATSTGGALASGTGGTNEMPGTGGGTGSSASGSGGSPPGGGAAGMPGATGTGGRGVGGSGTGTGGATPASGSGGAGGGGAPVTVPPGCTITSPVSYTKDVQQFLITSCGGGNGCHIIDATSTKASGGYDHGYDWITAGAHASSCPNKPTPARFQVVLDVINQANPTSCSKSRIMPPAGSGKTALTACQIATLASWLNEPLVTQMHRADDSSPTTPYPMPPYN